MPHSRAAYLGARNPSSDGRATISKPKNGFLSRRPRVIFRQAGSGRPRVLAFLLLWFLLLYLPLEQDLLFVFSKFLLNRLQRSSEDEM
jgi:hypothetical protein